MVGSIATGAAAAAARLWPRRSAPRGAPVLPSEADVLRDRREFEAVRAARIACLDAQAANRAYADLMRDGEWWTDDQIAYDRDPRACATCADLRPIEGAMRAAGVPARLIDGRVVFADCRVDFGALRDAFALSDRVQYLEPYPVNRWPGGPVRARLRCLSHGSQIVVLHTSEADAPLFAPAAPFRRCA